MYYTRNAKFVSEQNAASIALMGNCIVDLYGVNQTASYQFAFVYIRCVVVLALMPGAMF